MGRSDKHFTWRTYVLKLGRGWSSSSWLLWKLPKSHCPASDMSVLGKRAQLDTGPVERLGFSFVPSSWPALRDKKRQMFWAHSRWSFRGFFGFAWSIISQKGSSNAHERCTKSGFLTSGKRSRSPACTAYRARSQTSFSQVQSHRSGLESALAQMPAERTTLNAQAYTSGNGIWTQFGRYSQVLEKLGLCTLSEVIEIQIFILVLSGRKRRFLRERTGLIRELL